MSGDTRPAIDWDEALRLHEEDGWSFTEIAEKFGYSPKTVRVALAARGASMQARTRRGEMRRRLRQTWKHFREACSDPNHRAHHVYGALGFSVCARWQDFEAFYLWARESGYRSGLCLMVERDAKLYAPENCRWVKKTRVLPRTKRDYGRVDSKRAATIDWEAVKRLYVDEQIDPLEIARRYNTTRETIRNGLRKRGVQREWKVGLTQTPDGARFYRAWWSMHDRCINPKSLAYSYYGGRGVKVAAEWREFEPFLGWARETCQDPSLLLTRKDPSRNFSSKNCEWVTHDAVARKRRAPKGPMPPRKLVLAFGELRGVMEWSRDPRCMTSAPLLGQRLKEGWSAERAISEPPLKIFNRMTVRRELEAWGQTKGFAEWLRDRRCRIGHTGFFERLNRGWTVEAALSTPSFKVPASGGNGTVERAARTRTRWIALYPPKDT